MELSGLNPCATPGNSILPACESSESLPSSKTESAVASVFENAQPTHSPKTFISTETALNSLEDYVINGCFSEVKKIFDHMTSGRKQFLLGQPTPRQDLTLMSLAAYHGQESMIDLFIDAYTDESHLLEDLCKKQKFGSTPLYVAAQQGHEKIVEKLLNCFKNKEQRLSYQRQCIEVYKQTPLQIAAANGRALVVEYFLSQLEPNELFQELSLKDEFERTPLVFAVLKGSYHTIKVLLEKLTPQEQIQYLSLGDSRGINALMAGSIKKNKSVEALFDFCNVNFTKNTYTQLQDTKGHTALHHAIGPDPQYLTKLLNLLSDDREGLIQSLKMKERYGKTPINFAVSGKHFECASALLNIMKDLKIETDSDVFGRTVLHEIILNEDWEHCKWYAEHAPHTFHHKDLFGVTPLDLCFMHRQTEVLSELKKFPELKISENFKEHPLFGKPLVTINQIEIIAKLVVYLKKQKRLDEETLSCGLPEQLPLCFNYDDNKKKWDIRGLCQGLSFFHAFYSSENQLDQFYQALEHIRNWDERLESLQVPDPTKRYATLAELYENWMNVSFWMQHDRDSAFTELYSQSELQSRFEMIRPENVLLKVEGRLWLRYTHEQVKELINFIKCRPNCQFIISCQNLDEKHAIQISLKQDGSWSYYDSNFWHRFVEKIDDEKLYELFLSSFFSFPRPPKMELSLDILTFQHQTNSPVLEDDELIKKTFTEISASKWTSIHKALFAASTNLLKSLLKDSEDLERDLAAPDDHQNTPLHLAILLGAKDKIEAMLSFCNPQLQQKCLLHKDSNERIPLTLAVIKGRVEIVELLLSYGTKEEKHALLFENSQQVELLPKLVWIHPPMVAIQIYEALTRSMDHDQLFKWVNLPDNINSTLCHYAAYKNPILLERILKDFKTDEQSSLMNACNSYGRTPLVYEQSRKDQEIKKRQELEQLDVIKIVAGSQGKPEGSTEKEKVLQHYHVLQSRKPVGIYFNDQKIVGYVKGGNCTAMALDFAVNYLRMKKVGEITDQTTARELIDRIKILAGKYDITATRENPEVQEFRNIQEALNSIEVDKSQKNCDHSLVKIQACANLYFLTISHSSRERDFDSITVMPLLNRDIQKLSNGVHLLRFIASTDNEKMESHGHSMLLITEPQATFFFDPNFGTELIKRNTVDRIYHHLHQNQKRFELNEFRFYTLTENSLSDKNVTFSQS